MRALARGFLAGFGFALGASVAGTLIGYTIGRIGEASVKRLLSSERTSSPAPSSSPASSEQCCPAAADGHNGWCTVGRNPKTMAEAVAYRASDDGHDFVPGPQGCNYEPATGVDGGEPTIMGAIDASIETATRVRITPEVTKAFLRFAHPAPLRPNIRLALVAAFEAAGFEVEE